MKNEKKTGAGAQKTSHSAFFIFNSSFGL